MFLVQSESTLWRLKFFVKDALEIQGKSAASTGGNTNDSNKNNNNNNSSNNNGNNKRKKEICDSIAKTAKKKSKKPSSWSFQNMPNGFCFGCISSEQASLVLIRIKSNRFVGGKQEHHFVVGFVDT